MEPEMNYFVFTLADEGRRIVLLSWSFDAEDAFRMAEDRNAAYGKKIFFVARVQGQINRFQATRDAEERARLMGKVNELEKVISDLKEYL